MSQTSLTRGRAAAVAVVAGLAAGVLVVPAAEVATGTVRAAQATGPAMRVARSGPSNADPVKAVQVTCPDGMSAYAGGGAVDYGAAGNGGAALTAIVPDVVGHSVVVTATAPAGSTATWALIAYAVCSSSLEPVLVVRKGAGTARAACPVDQELFGVGFRVAGDPSVGHVTGIDLNPDLSAVRVTAGGPGGAAAEVTAIAVCRAPVAPSELVHARNDSAGWPKVAARRDDDPDLRPYATGATVTGPDAATLDAVVPADDDGVSWARGTLFGGPTPPAAAKEGGGDGGDGDGSATVETALIGTFH